MTTEKEAPQLATHKEVCRFCRKQMTHNAPCKRRGDYVFHLDCYAALRKRESDRGISYRTDDGEEW